MSRQLGNASMAAVRQYLRLAEDDGLDVTELLHGAGIPPELADDDSGRISGWQFQKLINTMTALTDDPLLGLRSADFVQPGSYSILGYITMSCATLGEAVARIAPYEKLVGDMGVTSLETGPSEATLTWQCAYPDAQVRPHMIDNVFGSWISYARWLANRPDAAPTRVALEHPSPGTALESAYTRRWNCPVLFDQPTSHITLPRSLLELPLRQPDPILRRTLEDHAQTQLQMLEPDQETSDLSARVSASIRQHLSEGITRQDLIAESLGLTARTLQRRLNHEGQSYQNLLDAVREEQACNLLRHSGHSVETIALRLGFSEVRSFHRRFRQWTGQSPGAFRGDR